ncbi:MAG: YlbF family regulator [Clostridia bacterium]|nr:YlbF family regulator [Clostridia bacterium]
MYIYDRAHLLAGDIKASEEYKHFKALKDELYADETTKALLTQYKKAQFEAQTTMLSGQQPAVELMEQLQKVGEVLALNPKVTEFFAAEYKFNTIVSDIYKIIGEACDIDTGLFDA